MNPLEIRMAHLEGAYEQVNQRLASIDGRLVAMDNRLSGRIDALDRKVDDGLRALDLKIDSRFQWTIGVVFGGWLTTILAVLLHR